MNNIDYKAVVEILENFLKKEKTEILGISVGEEYQLRQAIENLIKEYKELKEKNKKIEEELNRQINTRIINEEFIENNYISKDRINRKIEELKDNCYAESIDFNNELIEILQELLEGE